MDSDWKEIRLGDVAEVIGGGTPSSIVNEYWEGDIPWITPKDLSGYGYRYISRGERSISPLGLEKSSARLLPKNTVLITSRAPIGYVAISDVDVATSQGFKSLVLQEGHSPEFFYYLIKHNVYKLEAVSSGSTFKEISGKVMKQIALKIPSYSEQVGIAKVLGGLDNKIELNRQINETLEQMAQALFKSWFVDFDPVIDNALDAGNPIPEELEAKAEQRKHLREFAAKGETEVSTLPDDIRSLFPSEFEFTEEMGWIPKGWDVSTIGKECDFLNGYAFKSKELLSEPSEDSLHVFKMGNIKRGGGFNFSGTKSYYPSDSAGELDKFLLKKGDLLMSMTDMKSNMVILGHTALMSVDDIFLVNQRVGRIRPKPSSVLDYSYLYMYTNYREVVQELRSRANSGVQVNLSTSAIKDTFLLTPTEDIAKYYDDAIRPLLERTFKCEAEIFSLQATRDVLLPKLISGELQIPEAEQQVAEALN